MPRPARFGSDAILDAALNVVAEHGPSGVTIDRVAAAMGGHVGSIYYRFPTKDDLLARLWLRCAQGGQAGMLEALAEPDLQTAFESAALHYPRWARAELDTARILAAYGREQLSPHWPESLHDELAQVNDQLNGAILTFARRWYGDARTPHRRAATFALLDLPASAIRRYLLAGKKPPQQLDDVVLAAARAALDAG